MTAKDKIVIDLMRYETGKEFSPLCSDINDAEAIADFIIADRLRVVEPLVKFSKILNRQPLPYYENLCQGIEKTLKNAGVSL